MAVLKLPNSRLGILNSRLVSYLYLNTSSIATKDDFRQTTLAELRRLPIRVPVDGDRTGRDLATRIKQLSTEIQSGCLLLVGSRTEDERKGAIRRLDGLDVAIDRAVFDLYNLSPEEVEAVERGTKPATWRVSA